MTGDEKKYLSEIQEAYGLPEAEAFFIRHNENLTYRLEQKGGESFLLRIHRHKKGFTLDPVDFGTNETERRETEIKYLQFLKMFGLNVQAPVANKQGGYLTFLKDQTAVTLLTYLPGNTLTKDGLTSEILREIGELIFRMSKAAKQFQKGSHKSALSYDAALCSRISEKFMEMYQSGTIKKRETEILMETTVSIGEYLKEKEPDFHLNHSDLSLSNLILTADGLVPIDFSLCGYGCDMTDIGGILCQVSDIKKQKEIIKGYEKAGGETDDYGIACSFSLNILLGIVLHREIWPKEEWFRKRLPEWCGESFLPLIKKNKKSAFPT